MRDSKENIRKAVEMEKAAMDRSRCSGQVCRFNGGDVYMSHPEIGSAHISTRRWDKIVESLHGVKR